MAAENFYGDIARQIAGPGAHIASILTNPDADPHLFEASPSVARTIAQARIVISNGADYDPWMEKLLGVSSKVVDQHVIVVADLVHAASGANPHLWYDPRTVPAFARALAANLETIDPANANAYIQRLQDFTASLAPLTSKIAAMRAKYAGAAVTATEPVFGYMADALGLAMKNKRFQLAVMNDTEPSASDMAAFEHDLRSRTVRLLIYNAQVHDAMTARLLRIAKESRVPTVAVTETEPAGKTYQDWMLGQLESLDRALSTPPS